MPASRIPLFPSSLTLQIKLRLQELAGASLIGVALFASVFVATYSPLNPSWNTATGAHPGALVYAGFVVADVLKQLLGWGAWVLLISVGSFGARIVLHQKVLTTGRMVALLVSVLLFCTGIQGGCVKTLVGSEVGAEPFLPGGALGLLSARKICGIFQTHHLGLFFILFLIFIFVIFVFLWKYTLGLTFRNLYLLSQKIWQQIQRLRRYLQRMKTAKSPWAEASANEASDEEKEEALDLEEIPSKEDGVERTQAAKARAKGRAEKRISRGGTNGGGMLTYQLPSVTLLAPVKEEAAGILSREKRDEKAATLLSVLNEFGIQGEIMNIQPGPIVTMYEFRPAPGIKASRIISLSDDIARSMSALSARIANIPGKNAMGIEIPNDKRQTVFLRPLLSSVDYKQTPCALPLILGKDISGHPVLADLAKMPHLLVAGTTGSGKSVSINTMILSLLYRFSPEQCRFIMVDPKMLELSVYNDIPHLLTPVVTDPKKAVFALKWAVREMESRNKAMAQLGVRNIEGFNQKVAEGHRRGEVFVQRIHTGFDPESGKPIYEDRPLDYKQLPYIVVVVDEMADLMLVAGKEIEIAVQRLAQMARAAGIHLIMATQRPSVDVITGTIKANFPTRISFQVTSKIDSRTILGEQGAEHLLGHGDMLYMSGGGRVQRVHGPFASDADVEAVTTYLKTQGDPDYVEGITDEVEEAESLGGGGASSGGSREDERYSQALSLIHQEGRVSISRIQRQLGVGYNTAAKLVERMEKEGIVSAPDRTGKREILG